ncbi:MAG: CoB--CoM heterodisulfide reductase iron-sulfur subunit B family protein [Ignavibacteriae bacterium]|nr:CoB--CoM heterodisulfide reductase iron-sulfur subunit B family protein [Ignavibacteriota bacterium]
MTLGYYPGCSLTGTAKEYDRSLREVLAALGVEMEEIDDWSCCGASSAHATNHLLSVALPARNLLLAAKQKMDEVMAPCAACYNRLVAASHEIATRPGMREKVEYVLEEPYHDGVRVLNILELFGRIGADVVKEKVTLPLDGLKVACYYGCLLVRPSAVLKFDDAEAPVSMEAIVAATGAKTVEWNFKTECCGAAHSIAHTGIVIDLSKKILDDARAAGADLVLVACPMCHSNLDMRQRSMRKRDSAHQDLPVLYLSELVGLALGMEHKKLGLDLHFINPAPALAKASKKEAVA